MDTKNDKIAYKWRAFKALGLTALFSLLMALPLVFHNSINMPEFITRIYDIFIMPGFYAARWFGGLGIERTPQYYTWTIIFNLIIYYFAFFVVVRLYYRWKAIGNRKK